jgi:hypothetical protein
VSEEDFEAIFGRARQKASLMEVSPTLKDKKINHGVTLRRPVGTLEDPFGHVGQSQRTKKTFLPRR